MSMVVLLILSWLGIGLLAGLAGFLGLFAPPLSLLLLVPLYFQLNLAMSTGRHFLNLSKHEKYIAGGILFIWLSHLIQVFTPETGFDALWYHLPVAKAVAQSHGFIYLPDLYQSVNPQFSDSIFYLGWLGLADTGTKLVAYALSITLIAVTYSLARIFLPRLWSLLFVLQVSVFQVVAWQAASFYVDQAKALWEVAAVWLLIEFWRAQEKTNSTNKLLVLSALALSASLASKLFSLLLVPLMLVMVWRLIKGNSRRVLLTITYAAICFSLAVGFYILAEYHTGNAFYSFSEHLGKLSHIGGGDTLWQYVWQRTVQLPLSPLTLLSVRDYVSPLVVLLLPLLAIRWPNIWRDKMASTLLIFSLGQWLVWWYVPPLSTRYALSGFIVFLLLEFGQLVKVMETFKQSKREKVSQIAVALIVLTVTALLVPRIYVNFRSLKYVSGQQNKTEYLSQFLDGSIDTNIKTWHKLSN